MPHGRLTREAPTLQVLGRLAAERGPGSGPGGRAPPLRLRIFAPQTVRQCLNVRIRLKDKGDAVSMLK